MPEFEAPKAEPEEPEAPEAEEAGEPDPVQTAAPEAPDPTDSGREDWSTSCCHRTEAQQISMVSVYEDHVLYHHCRIRRR
jgi:hypothetical protein